MEIADGSQMKREESTKSEDKRPQFGTRFLTDDKNVFQHNAWDNVTWNEEQEKEAQMKVENNSSVLASRETIEKCESEANEYWNKFYAVHDNRFFKDRNWLFTEFPELLDYGKTAGRKDGDDDPRVTVLEVGCGAGNTVFPILETNNDANLFVYACDFSKTAVEIVRNHDQYDEKRCHAFVFDVADDEMVPPFPENSLDFVILIFVLSAVNPDRMQRVTNKLSSYLKPGGTILFRDYGRYDMAQLRFKPGRCLADNFYARGDGTRVYFFTQGDVDELFMKAGLVKDQNVVDRRLQVNRSKLLKMYRVWIQCKYRKPSSNFKIN